MKLEGGMAIPLGGDKEKNLSPNLIQQLSAMEKELITRALVESGGVKTKAADYLGINEATLRYKMKKHGIIITRRGHLPFTHSGG